MHFYSIQLFTLFIEKMSQVHNYCSCILDIIILIITYIRKICKNYAEQNMRTNDIAMT